MKETTTAVLTRGTEPTTTSTRNGTSESRQLGEVDATVEDAIDDAVAAGKKDKKLKRNSWGAEVELTFAEDLIGSQPPPDLHRTYIASKGPDAQSIEEEVAAVGVDGVVEKGKTIFAKDDQNRPHLWDYMFRGFFKAAASAMHRTPGSLGSDMRAFKKVIDQTVFVFPRKIMLESADGSPIVIGNLQRSLRVNGPSGERVAIAHSERIPAGTKLRFTVKVLDGRLKDTIMEWLDYGQLSGMGQWRNGSFGRFEYKIIRSGLMLGRLASTEITEAD